MPNAWATSNWYDHSMRTLLLSLAVLLVTNLNSHAQKNVVPKPPANAAPVQTNGVTQGQVTAETTTQTNTVSAAQAMRARNAALWVHRNLMQRIFGMNVSYSGALVPPSQARRAPPLPPNAPGYPFENVSINPITGRAEGITLLSIHF